MFLSLPFHKLVHIVRRMILQILLYVLPLMQYIMHFGKLYLHLLPVIKDQAYTDEELLLADVESSILRKYISTVGE